MMVQEGCTESKASAVGGLGGFVRRDQPPPHISLSPFSLLFRMPYLGAAHFKGVSAKLRGIVVGYMHIVNTLATLAATSASTVER